MKISTTCIQCGKEIQTVKKFGQTRYYCDRVCSLKYMKENNVGFHANLPTRESDKKFKEAKNAIK